MPVNGYSVGRDIALDMIGPNGPVTFNKITSFKAKQDTSDVRVKRLDGITDHLIFPDGWSGSFEIERQDSGVDDLFAQLEAGFYAGLNQISYRLTETITEVAGNVSQYRYEGVILKYDDAGDWKGDSSVKQSVSFMASRRIKVA